MTAQPRTGPPVDASRPRRAPAAATVLASLAIAGAPLGAASWPADPMVRILAAPAPTPPPADSGNVTFRVVPAPTTPPTHQPPTHQPPTPGPTPSGGQLPVTGGDPTPGWLPGLGALLVLGGAIVLVAVRRGPRPHRRR
jgi:hypothetical protein